MIFYSYGRWDVSFLLIFFSAAIFVELTDIMRKCYQQHPRVAVLLITLYASPPVQCLESATLDRFTSFHSEFS